MSNGADEIRDIRKRLEETERAIGELRSGDLAIMKIMAAELCEMHYNIFIVFQKGEEVAKYIEHWSKRLADTKLTIQSSETTAAIIETRNKFVKDITDYTKREKADSNARAIEKAASAEKVVEEVDNADKAMDIAHSFIKQDSSVALPLKAERLGNVWLVDVDAGAVGINIVRVKLDARTGEILSHETVEKK